MYSWKNIIGHLKTIINHKIIVAKLLCSCHLYYQALMHDMSKFSWVELKTGFKYYQGFRSPIEQERELKGYSPGWLHHKGRNKHHWEYWLDNSNYGLKPLVIPKRYLVEMFCDRVAASKNYLKDKYNDQQPLKYFLANREKITLHPESETLLIKLLTMLAEQGLTRTISYIRSDILENK